MKILHEFYFYAIYKIYGKIFGIRWAYVKSPSIVRITDSIAILNLAFIFLIVRKITPKISIVEIIIWVILLFLEFFYADKNIRGDKHLQVINEIDSIRRNKNYFPFIMIYSITPILVLNYFLLPRYF